MNPFTAIHRRGALAVALACIAMTAAPPVLASGGAAQADAGKDVRYLVYVPSRAIGVDHDANIRAFEDNGFSVHTMAPAGESDYHYVMRVRDEIRSLIARGVAPEAITVVGAGIGSPLTALVSSATGNRNVNYVLLGGCDARLARAPRFHLSGRVLGLRDADDSASPSCRPLWRNAPKLTRQHDMVLSTGKGAALFDAPDAAWVQQVVHWGSSGQVGLGTMKMADAHRWKGTL